MQTQAAAPAMAPIHGAEAAAEAQAWERWRATRSEADREDLWHRHSEYARTLAALLYRRRFSDDIEFADYLQYAHVGLLEAMDRFDPARGAQFRTFAARRIQGAILNGLERQTERQQQIAARQRIRADRARDVHDSAMESSGWCPNAGDRQVRQLMAYVADVGFGLALGWLLEGTGLVDAGADAGQAMPFYRTTELRQARERLLRALDALPAQERHVLRCHYLQDIRFDEIARDLGLTKGRISQVHKKGLLHLREALSGGPVDLAC